MGNRLNRLGEPVFMAVSKTLLTEFGIHHRLESCVAYYVLNEGILLFSGRHPTMGNDISVGRSFSFY